MIYYNSKYKYVVHRIEKKVIKYSESLWTEKWDGRGNRKTEEKGKKRNCQQLTPSYETERWSKQIRKLNASKQSTQRINNVRND